LPDGIELVRGERANLECDGKPAGCGTSRIPAD
jgi:hypothetical protein